MTIAKGQEVMATRPGLSSRPEKATVIEVLLKGFEVGFKRDGKIMRLAAKKVKPLLGPKRAPLPRKKPPIKKRGMTPADSVESATSLSKSFNSTVSTAARSEGTAIPKPRAPEKSPAYIEFIRSRPCCNCGKNARSEAHHEGKKGVSQKVRDTLAVPLCHRCHSVYTDFNELPHPVSIGTQWRLTRGASLRILHDAQDECLRTVLDQIHAKASDLYRDLISSMLGQMDQQQLADLLKGL